MHLRPCCALLLLASTAGFAQSSLPEVAPGLRIPNGSGALPLALDHYEGKPELVVIHHSTVEVNNHTGANVAGSLAASVFYKPKMTTELAGLHARIALHDPRPSFFVHLLEDPDSSGDAANSDTAVWAIVAASETKDHRVFAKVQFTQLTGHAKRAQGSIESETERLGNGWLKITPKADLAPGEYAIMPVPRTPNTFSTVVFDFALDPTAANAPGALLPTP
ncbi:MAG: hypothetical protein M3O02_03935 [Acidobacteriota bacterium]|nr:hypothetical protein [Acidobacteriota bacterium]